MHFRLRFRSASSIGLGHALVARITGIDLSPAFKAMIEPLQAVHVRVRSRYEPGFSSLCTARPENRSHFRRSCPPVVRTAG